MPRKTFTFNRSQDEREPLDLPPDLTVEGALQRVLRLPSVASKRFLTSKVGGKKGRAEGDCCALTHLVSPVADAYSILNRCMSKLYFHSSVYSFHIYRPLTRFPSFPSLPFPSPSSPPSVPLRSIAASPDWSLSSRRSVPSRSLLLTWQWWLRLTPA